MPNILSYKWKKNRVRFFGHPSQFENQSQKFFLRQTLEKKIFLVLGQIFRVKQVSSSKKMDLTLNLRPTGELQI